MATIGAADWFGLPVSTRHVLSSGIGGTMAANGSGPAMGNCAQSGDGQGTQFAGLDLLAGFLFWAFRSLSN